MINLRLLLCISFCLFSVLGITRAQGLKVLYKIEKQGDTCLIKITHGNDSISGYKRFPVFKYAPRFPKYDAFRFIADSISLSKHIHKAVIVWKNGVAGIKTLENEWLVPMGQFPDSVRWITGLNGTNPNLLYVLYKHGKLAVVEGNSVQFTGYLFDSVANYGAYGMLPVKQNKKWGFYPMFPGYGGTIACQFDSVGVYDYNSKTAPVILNGEPATVNLTGLLTYPLKERLRKTQAGWEFNSEGVITTLDSVLEQTNQVTIGFAKGKPIVIKETLEINEYDSIVTQTRFQVKSDYLVRKADKYGLINLTGYELLPCIYEAPIEKSPYSGVIKVKLNGKYALLNIHDPKKEYVGFILDEVDLSLEPHQLPIIRVGQKYGIFNNNQKVFSADSLKFDDVKRSDGNCYAVKQNGKYRICNYLGQPNLFEEYDSVAFHGFWVVKKGARFGALSGCGRRLLPTEYDSILTFKHVSWFIAKNAGNHTIYGLSGSMLNYKPFQNFTMTSNGMVVRTTAGLDLLNCIASECEQPIPYYFDEYTDVGGFLVIRKGNMCGIFAEKNWLVSMDIGQITYNDALDELYINRGEIEIKLRKPTVERVRRVGYSLPLPVASEPPVQYENNE